MSQYQNPKPIIDLAQLLEDKGIKFRENSSSELIMDQCYNCGRSKKLYVNKETGVFVCFRCEEKGNGVKLLAKYLGISFKEASKILYGGNAKINASLTAVMEEEDEPLVLNLGGLSKTGNKTKDLGLPPAMKLAPEYVKLTAEQAVPYKYLIDRGYTPEDIDELNLKVLPFSDFSQAWKSVETRLKGEGLTGDKLKEGVKEVVRCIDRIIFPVYIDFQVLGYVARDYTGTKQPKVLNSKGNFRSFSVWNFDNAKDSEELVICEGTTSAVKSGINRSIALLGKIATVGQIRLIRKMKAKKIFICLDIGTEKEIQNLYKALSVYYPGKIFLISLPPVIDLKIKPIEGLIDKINNDFKTTISHIEDKNQIFMLNQDKIKIISSLGIANKLPSDEKRSLFRKKMKEKSLFTEEEVSQISWLLFESEYKDSGDYTHLEMDEYIKQAKPISGGLDLG